ncbi:MAG: hypothetical protein JW745_08690 [Sedimentisphaerales bacterium]|nr:hypothetical protein [Sedimentisphaerales bacterium]MBN2843249.1 hypothetical protein [Sedimentisphaerales bacterium]
MIFLTVGTQFEFDRLTKAVDDLVGQGLITETIYGQIGSGKYQPVNFDYCQTLEKDMFDKVLANSDAIISHAGMGTITMALEYNKPLLVLPRRAKYKEVVNDHQVGIARKFQELGHLLLAEDESELPAKIRELASFTPKPRVNQADKVAARVKQFLDEI